jgi:hypothetical protein
MVFAGIVLASSLLFLIYLSGTAHVSFGGDSGDIILAYFFGGVPHPPGYPLNTFLGYLLTKIVPAGSFAFKANVISGIYMAAGAGIFSLLLYRISRNYLLYICAAGVLAFLPLYWLYAHIAEVFQLTIILVLASVILLLDFWAKPGKRNNRKRLYFSVFFLGLASFHHQTVLLLMPAYIYTFVKTGIVKLANIKELFVLSGTFFAGIVPYVYVFWAASRKTPVNWDDPSNFAGFARLITRADYGTFTAAPDLIAFSPAARLVQVLWYFKVVLADFGYFGLGLVILGGAWLFVRERRLFWFFLLCAVFTGPFFLAYASFPPLNSLLAGISERFLLTNYVFLAVFLFFGMLATVEKLKDFAKKRRVRRLRLLVLLITGVWFIFPFYMFLANKHKTDLSQSRLGDFLGRDVLLAAWPSGIVLVQGDTLTFNTLYTYYVDGVNPEAIVLMTGRLNHRTYREQVKNYYPGLKLPENFLSDSAVLYKDTVLGLIESNFESIPVYSYTALPVPEKFTWIQQGMLKRLYLKDSLPEDAEIASRVREGMGRMVLPDDFAQERYLNLFEENIKSSYSGVFSDNGFELLRHGAVDDSQGLFEKAVEMYPENLNARFGLGVFYFEKRDCGRAKVLFEEITAFDPAFWQAWEGLGHTYKTCFTDDAAAEEFFKRSVEERSGDLNKPVREFLF